MLPALLSLSKPVLSLSKGAGYNLQFALALAQVIQHDIGKKDEDCDSQDQPNHAFDQSKDQADHEQANDDRDDRVDTGDIHSSSS